MAEATNTAAAALQTNNLTWHADIAGDATGTQILQDYMKIVPEALPNVANLPQRKTIAPSGATQSFYKGTPAATHEFDLHAPELGCSSSCRHHSRAYLLHRTPAGHRQVPVRRRREILGAWSYLRH